MGGLLLFLYVFSIEFIQIPASTSKYTFVACIGILFFFRTRDSRLTSFPGPCKIVFIAFLVLGLYNLLSTTFQGQNEYSLAIGFTTVAIFNIVGSYLLVNVLYRLFRLSRENAPAWIACVIFVQSIFIFIGFLSPGFRHVTAAFIAESGNIDATDAMRIRGLSNSSGAGASLLFAIGAAMSLASAVDAKTKKLGLFFLVTTVSCAMATFFTGRTGMFTFALFLPLYFLISYAKRSLSRKTVKIYLLIVGSIIIVPIVVFNYLLPAETRDFIGENVLGRAFTMYFSVVEHGTIRTRTTDYIINEMLFLPDSEKTFLFGDALFIADGGNYMRTDSGYIRYIFAMGFLGCLVLYGAILYMFRVMIRNSPSQVLRTALLTLLILIAIAEIKEPFFVKASIGRTLMFLFVASFLPLVRSSTPTQAPVPAPAAQPPIGLSGSVSPVRQRRPRRL